MYRFAVFIECGKLPWIFDRRQPRFHKQPRRRSNYAVVWFLVAFTFLKSLGYAEDKGRQRATTILARHIASENNPGSLIVVNIGNREKTLRHLACGARNCAGIEEISNTTYYFPQSNGYHFTDIPDDAANSANRL